MQWLYEIHRFSLFPQFFFFFSFLFCPFRKRTDAKEDLFLCRGRNISTYYELRRNPMPNWSSSCHSHHIIRLLGPPLLDDGLRSLSASFLSPSPSPELPQPPRANPCFSLRRFLSFRGHLGLLFSLQCVHLHAR